MVISSAVEVRTVPLTTLEGESAESNPLEVRGGIDVNLLERAIIDAVLSVDEEPLLDAT